MSSPRGAVLKFLTILRRKSSLACRILPFTRLFMRGKSARKGSKRPLNGIFMLSTALRPPFWDALTSCKAGALPSKYGSDAKRQGGFGEMHGFSKNVARNLSFPYRKKVDFFTRACYDIAIKCKKGPWPLFCSRPGTDVLCSPAGSRGKYTCRRTFYET